MTTDEELKQVLGNIDLLPEDMHFQKRIYVKVPKEKFDKCPESIGDSTKKMDDPDNGYYKIQDKHGELWTQLGATGLGLRTPENPKGAPIASYDAKQQFKKDTVKTWITEFGSDAFSMFYPEQEVSEVV